MSTIEILERRVAMLEEQVARLSQHHPGPPSASQFADRVYSAVAEEWGIPEVSLRQRCKEWRVSERRHFVAWTLRYVGHFTFERIAELMGRKDHQSAAHACRRASEILEAYPPERARLDRVIAKVCSTETSTTKAPHA